MEPPFFNKSKTGGNPYDINGQHFNPDMYLQKLFKDHSLKEVMEQEETIVRDTQTLHSEMQTLVYENYNKFISATDTIRKMKSDFKQMETEMDLLGQNMDSITLFSDQISHTLQDTRQQISKLSGIHILLKRLQFLFKLPNKLKSLLEEGNYKQAIDDYVHTQQVLNHYAHLESFKGIQYDCLEIVELLKEKLYSQFESNTASTKDVAEGVELLLLLNEPADTLYQKYLAHASLRLKSHLEILENLLGERDLIELVDLANNSFFSDFCLIVTSYKEIFLSENKSWEISGQSELDDWINEKMNSILALIEKKAYQENDTPVLVRGLDRLCSTLSATTSLFSYDFTRRVTEIGVKCGERECNKRKADLGRQLTDSLIEARHSLSDQPSEASELLQTLIIQTIGAVETHVAELQVLKNGELSFTSDRNLRDSIEGYLRDILVIGFLEDMINLAQTFTTTTISLPALLVLAKMCLEFSNSHIHNLLRLVGNTASSEEERLTKEMLTVAQNLGNHYVKLQGNIIGQMIRKSVETRDWAHSSEPRNVRAVMRRILEELSAAEPIASLFEDGPVQPPGSGSRHHARSGTGVSWADHGYTHNLHKLFSDKIEIFTAIEFTKTSILTGIIKISLKTLLECVRLRTFNKYGFQQIQVDIHFLQLHLWKFISDEKLLQFLLGEILASAEQRCLDPVPIVESIVDIICEKEKKIEKNQTVK